MRSLNGAELAEYIKQRQVQQVRGLRQANGVAPKLAIIVTVENKVIDVYMRLKQQYGADIAVDVDVHRVSQTEVPALIAKLNDDLTVHAIILQLPLQDPAQTDELTALVLPEKDVDGLGAQPNFDPATPLAVMWLLAGYNIDLRDKSVLIVGRGKLVGRPLEKLMLASGVTPRISTKETNDLREACLEADVIITATGVAGLITADMIKEKAVVVDAGVASEGGKTVGDLAPDVYERDDLTLTPTRGGVGPMTVCALFDNTIIAARRSIQAS
ncbi:MAG: bifunctional 5,10-methylenetetrahydrofolate dehydrogenase/5,10-methenyltetrahydrofolate cyclohydrolase [Candidatus Saccharimonadales bacterium]